MQFIKFVWGPVIERTYYHSVARYTWKISASWKHKKDYTLRMRMTDNFYFEVQYVLAKPNSNVLNLVLSIRPLLWKILLPLTIKWSFSCHKNRRSIIIKKKSL